MTLAEEIEKFVMRLKKRRRTLHYDCSAVLDGFRIADNHIVNCWSLEDSVP